MPPNHRDPATLTPHPLSLAIYGKDESLGDLQASIATHGVITPLVITAAGQIISGNRRQRAALASGLPSVPVEVSPLTDPLDIEQAVIEANRQRTKTREQLGREFAELKRIEEARAKQRMAEGGAVGGQRSTEVRYQRTAPALHALKPARVTYGPVESETPPEDFDQTPKSTKSKGVANLPPPSNSPGKARNFAAASLGLKPRTAEKMLAVVEYADRTGDREVLDTLNHKSADAAFAQVKRKTGQAPPPPPFNAQYSNVWNFAAPTNGIGIDYPGRIPGDVLRNLLWLYTQADDLIADPFAGGGITHDAVKWWNQAPGLWKLRQWSGDIEPVRTEIAAHDCSQPPYLPKKLKDIGLVFLDPPYWSQKKGAYNDHPHNFANLGQSAFTETLLAVIHESVARLRSGGHVALLMGATQKEGRFIDHAFEIACHAEGMGLTVIQRIIVPYTTQQFRGADVTWARDNKQLLKAYRDLVIFRP